MGTEYSRDSLYSETVRLYNSALLKIISILKKMGEDDIVDNENVLREIKEIVWSDIRSSLEEMIR